MRRLWINSTNLPYCIQTHKNSPSGMPSRRGFSLQGTEPWQEGDRMLNAPTIRPSNPANSPTCPGRAAAAISPKRKADPSNPGNERPLSFTRSLLHSFTSSLIHFFTRSLLHSFTSSLVHFFTHSLHHSPRAIVRCSLFTVHCPLPTVRCVPNHTGRKNPPKFVSISLIRKK